MRQVRSRPPLLSLPAGFPFGKEDSLGASRDRRNGGLVWAQGMCEYDPVICRWQGRSDPSLFRWVNPTPICNDWNIVEYPPRDLRSSSRIEEEGRGRETRLTNVGFRSEEFGGFAKNLP